MAALDVVAGDERAHAKQPPSPEVRHPAVAAGLVNHHGIQQFRQPLQLKVELEANAGLDRPPLVRRLEPDAPGNHVHAADRGELDAIDA